MIVPDLVPLVLLSHGLFDLHTFLDEMSHELIEERHQMPFIGATVH